jgi:hypothetical protein
MDKEHTRLTLISRGFSRIEPERESLFFWADVLKKRVDKTKGELSSEGYEHIGYMLLTISQSSTHSLIPYYTGEKRRIGPSCIPSKYVLYLKCNPL